MEAGGARIIPFGFKYCVGDDTVEKREHATSKISDTITTTSDFIHRYKTHRENLSYITTVTAVKKKKNM